MHLNFFEKKKKNSGTKKENLILKTS